MLQNIFKYQSCILAKMMKASVPKVRWGEWAKEFADEIHTDLFGDLLQLLHLEDSATTSALPTTGVGGQQSGSFESNPEQISCLWQRLAPGRPHQKWSHEYSGNCEHFWGILRGREGGCGGPTRHGVSYMAPGLKLSRAKL